MRSRASGPTRGRPRWPSSTSTPRSGRWATRRRTTRSGGATTAATPGRDPRPADPTPSRDILAEFAARLAGGQMASQHPRQFGYFTPPPLAMSMMGELLAQMANQGVDVWHAGPLASFVEEEVRPLAVRPRRLRWRLVRPAHVGRRDGQLHGDGDRPRPASRADPRDRAAAARRRARRVPRLRQRPDALLGRAGARPPRLPERHPRDRPVRRRRSGCTARRSRRPSRATWPRA